MVTLRNIFVYLEKIGLFSMHEDKKSGWRKHSQIIYISLHNCFLWIGVCAHLYSTVTRAIRYTPELCQAICEDAFLFTCLIALDYSTLNYRKVMTMLYFMENSFIKADEKVIRKCQYKSKIVCFVICCLLVGSAVGAILESLMPLSPAELKIRRMIYQTKHPERRLPYNMRVPFIDETGQFYEILYALSLYGIFLYVSLMCTDFASLPVIVTHVQGQYEILAKYTRLLGDRHFDEDGNEIFYTNIEANEFQRVTYKDRYGRRLDEDVIMKRRHAYEQQYLRQIVMFHHKLLKFHEMLLDLISPVMLLVIFTCTLIIATLLIQLLLFDLSQISTFRLVKMIVELGTVLGGYFFIANVSEISDDCNGLMRQALTECAWTECSNETRKDIIVLMLRVQLPHLLVLYNGAVILGRVLFLNTVKTAYSFVNFVRAGVK